MLKRIASLRSWRGGLQLAFVAVLVLLSMGATDSDTRFNTLGHRLMCTCGCGQVLMECNHVGCQSSDRMRAELMAVMQGRAGDPNAPPTSGGRSATAASTAASAPQGNAAPSDDEVLNWFVQKYGPVVLAAPTKTGFNRVAWIMPYLTLAVGIILTGVLVRAWKSRSKAAPVVSPAMVAPTQLDDLRRRVHEETEI